MSSQVTRPRRHVVVDLETTGLELHHQVTEAAWYDLGTNEFDQFVPPHTLEGAAPVALEMTGYHTRIATQPVDDGTRTRAMWERLGGDGAKVTIWGANPGFDQRNMMGLFARAGLSSQPFHHRPLDPCQGAYWLFPDVFEFGETPGLADVAALLDVPMSHHEALADVMTTVAVIRAIEKRRILTLARHMNTSARR
jgi:hypothetical protein